MASRNRYSGRYTGYHSRKKIQRSDLDKIVIMCVIAGVIMTVGPLLIWWIRGDTIPDSYFQSGFSFWGKELIASVAVYALKRKKKPDGTNPEEYTEAQG